MDIHWKREWTITSVVGVVSFGVGAGIGYAVRSYKAKRDESIRPPAVVEAFEFDWDAHFNHPPPAAEELATRLMSMLDHPAGTMEPEEQDEELATINVFPELVHDGWDYSEEEANRGPEKPYILHRDEYDNENDGSLSQSTLTYYAGDDILTDEHDVPVYNYGTIVGELKFGHGSGDPHIVYVRNEHLKAEYEVILDSGFYSVEVLGQEIEDSFERRDKSPLPKFKQDQG